MADNADIAQKLQEEQLAISLANRTRPMVANGYCYYCLEQIENGLFCDKDCASDYERLKKAGKI